MKECGGVWKCVRAGLLPVADSSWLSSCAAAGGCAHGVQEGPGQGARLRGVRAAHPHRLLRQGVGGEAPAWGLREEPCEELEKIGLVKVIEYHAIVFCWHFNTQPPMSSPLPTTINIPAHPPSILPCSPQVISVDELGHGIQVRPRTRATNFQQLPGVLGTARGAAGASSFAATSSNFARVSEPLEGALVKTTSMRLPSELSPSCSVGLGARGLSGRLGSVDEEAAQAMSNANGLVKTLSMMPGNL